MPISFLSVHPSVPWKVSGWVGLWGLTTFRFVPKVGALGLQGEDFSYLFITGAKAQTIKID